MLSCEAHDTTIIEVFTDRHKLPIVLQASDTTERDAWVTAMTRTTNTAKGARLPLRHVQLRPLTDWRTSGRGAHFLQQCMAAVETCGAHEQGVYRNCGVSSRVHKLLRLAEQDKIDGDRLGDEWEVNTITSAVKAYLRYGIIVMRGLVTTQKCRRTVDDIQIARVVYERSTD